MTKWAIVYREISLQLYKFWQSNKRAADASLFRLLSGDVEYVKANTWITKLATKFEADRLDPIQLFCSFSSSAQKPTIRTNNINHILRLLGSTKNYGDIDYEGCPAPFTIRMNSARKRAEQQEIWSVFQTVIKSGKAGLLQKHFDKAQSWYGIDTSAFTIFLFWIDPGNFIPLDKHTVDYLYGTKIISARPNTFFQYMSLLDSIPQSNIQNVVAIAYQQRNKKAPSQREIISKPGATGTVSADAKPTADFVDDFRFLGLTILPEIDSRLNKVLEHGWYLFYKCYDFINRDRVRYLADKDVDLYSNDNFKIQISAIVGANGSGKSTLTELFYAAINNLAYALPKFDEKLTPVSGLYIDLYFRTDFLYRLQFRGGEIQLYQFEFADNTYSYPQEINLLEFDFGHFFYSVAVNYAHYSLNSTHIGNWIDRLFHKNDGYQTPIVINPYRKKGNINVNREHELLKNRLLANLLEPVPQLEESDELRPNMRQITEKQGAKSLTFSVNIGKFGAHYNDGQQLIKLYEQGKGWDTVIPAIYNVFKIDIVKPINIPGKRHDWVNLIHNYLLRKVVNIATRYTPYQDYFDFEKLQLKDIPGLIKLIRNDLSHITFKFKQAINFLKYHGLILPLIDFTTNKPSISIEELSIIIERIKIKEPNENHRTLELLPPSFFDTDIILNDDELFHDLSSGEKQRIYTVSSVVYHLINLSSVSDIHQFTRYRFINIIFDEVELYFHPEMQRAFIDYLLNYLSYVDLNLSGLNFLFITHSPFILSDIPSNNILFLNPAEDESEFGQTLGANIHDLLAHNFFLKKGFMGEFIKKQVRSLTSFLTTSGPDTAEWNEHKVRNVIDALGEPLIKDRLEILYQLKYPGDIDLQIEELEIKLNQLKDAKNKR